MSKTESLILTEKERQSIIEKFKHYNLFGDMPHIQVEGVTNWPPAETANDAVAVKKKG